MTLKLIWMEPGVEEIICDCCNIEIDIEDERIAILCQNCSNKVKKVLADNKSELDIKIKKVEDWERD